MERIVIIRHAENGKYLFRVPQDKHLKAGDMVLCQTRRGIVPGMCCCDSFDTDKEETIKKAFGLSENVALAPIIGDYQFNMWGGHDGEQSTIDFDSVLRGND